MKPYIALAAFGVLATNAVAQRPDTGDAADPRARVPATQYESAFKSYVPYREQELRTWRELNDDVARAGGHVGIFGGAGHAAHSKPGASKPAPGQPASQAQDAPTQPPVRGAPKAPAAGHQGH